jgi:DNA invertase Pin-like site-specific DNA recombinase
MKAAIYARVSTEDQTVDNQLQVLQEVATTRHLEVYRVYQENVSAWHDGHQVELTRLMDDARRGHFQIVLVWALDRLTREGPMKQILIWYELQRAGVKLFSYQQPFTDLPEMVTPIIMSVFGYLGNEQSRLQSERSKAGIARARKVGGGKRGPDTYQRERRWKRRPV